MTRAAIDARYIDKTVWGDGPWQSEVDRKEWFDEFTGLPCLILRGSVGCLNGYVGVPKGHPAYGKHYDDVDVAVHGGLTYADEGNQSIRHLTDGPNTYWWLGFDTAHAYDLMPFMNGLRVYHDIVVTAEERGETYRTIEYVEEECALLAKQLADMQKPLQRS